MADLKIKPLDDEQFAAVAMLSFLQMVRFSASLELDQQAMNDHQHNSEIVLESLGRTLPEFVQVMKEAGMAVARKAQEE